jgi:hypothetical protein
MKELVTRIFSFQKTTDQKDCFKFEIKFDINTLQLYDNKRFIELETLGKGGSGMVIKAWDDNKYKFVSIKHFQNISKAFSEIDNQEKFDHSCKGLMKAKYIFKYVNESGKNEGIVMVMQAAACNLYELIKERKQKKFILF